MPAAIQCFATVGEIARRLGEPIHRVSYVINSRRIKPVGRAGNAHVYAEANVPYIATELHRITKDRTAETAR